MQQWALILGDTLLLGAALAGGMITLIRTGPLGRAAAVLSASGCLVLLATAVFDLIWWTVLFPGAVRDGDEAIRSLTDAGKLATNGLIAIGAVLLLAAAHAGRSAAGAARAAAPGPATPGAGFAAGPAGPAYAAGPAGPAAGAATPPPDRSLFGAIGAPGSTAANGADPGGRHSEGTGRRPAAAVNGPRHGAPDAPVEPSTAGGWTPPQQAQPNDWRHQSGVWSIPPGTFDRR